MNTRSAKIGAFSLLLALTNFAAVHAVRSQTIEPPPVKMGLWQTETNTTVAGMENTPMAGKHSTATQGCLTPDTWKSGLQKMNDPSSNCKVTNTHQDSHSITFDETCSSDRYNSDVHFEALIDSEERVRGTGKAHITAQGLPQPMTMDMSFTSRYLSASCGDVKPGEGKVIRAQ